MDIENTQLTLADKRIAFLTAELKNGGRGHTFGELKEMALREIPGGQGLNEKIVQKLAYAMEQGIEPKTADEVWQVKLPWSRQMTKWMEDRERKRLSFLSTQKAKEKYNKKIKRLGVKSLKELDTEKPKVKKAKTKKMHPLEAITRAQETSLDNILSSVNELPEELRDHLLHLKFQMEKHKFRKLEFTVGSDAAHLTLEPIAQPFYTKL